MTLAAFTRLWLYLGAMLVVGDAALAFGHRAPASDVPGEPELTRRLIIAGWMLLLMATALLLLLQARDMELEATVESLRVLFSTAWGRGWLLLCAAGCAGTVAAVLRLPRPFRVGAAFAVAITMGGLGHASADDAFPLLARVVDALHVLAVGAWLGGLALVAWMRWRATSATQHTGWGGFSRMATFAAPVAVVTGVLAGWRRLQLAPLDQGTATPMSLAGAATSGYGLLLGAKLALAAMMLALGYRHRRRVLEEYAPSWNTVFTELALTVAVLVVTGVLTGTAPPGE